MGIEFEILPPTMPDFIYFKQEAALRQDGFKVNDGFPIEKLSKAEAEKFANLMASEFIKHWVSKQK
jgi:hypothetical protein